MGLNSFYYDGLQPKMSVGMIKEHKYASKKHLPTYSLGHALMRHKFAMVCLCAMVPKLMLSGAMMLRCGASKMLIGNL